MELECATNNPVPLNQECVVQALDIDNGKDLWFFFVVDLHCRICNGFHFSTLDEQNEKKKDLTYVSVNNFKENVTFFIINILNCAMSQLLNHEDFDCQVKLLFTCGCLSSENSSPHLQ